jgi:hypothetical protein
MLSLSPELDCIYNLLLLDFRFELRNVGKERKGFTWPSWGIERWFGVFLLFIFVLGFRERVGC